MRGELQMAIMEVLRDSTKPLTVRQVAVRLTNRDLAHTTVMTLLDRLARKGFAHRQRDGRAWRYCPVERREDHDARLMAVAVRLAAVAARFLPAADRARFAEEWASELWELTAAGATRRAQPGYAARQLACALPVRFALLAPRRRGAAP